MPKWSERLIKSTVDLTVLTPPPDCSPEERQRIVDLGLFCEGRFEDKERTAAARQRLLRAEKRGPRSAAVAAAVRAALAELLEIDRDLDFAASRRGQFVLFVNDWAEGFHAELRDDRALDQVALGADPGGEAIVAAGTVASFADLTRLALLLERHPSGTPLRVQVTVRGAEPPSR